MKKLILSFLTAIGTITCAMGAGFTDTFDVIDPAWVTDRYDPMGFNSVFFDGDNRLEITLDPVNGPGSRPSAYSSAFYNTQGRKREALVGDSWIIAGELYISPDMVDGTNLRRTDLWGRTGTVGTETGADYPIMGVAQFDPSDPFNPLASGITSSWRVWDPDTGGWIYLSESVDLGWNELMVVGSSTSYEFYLNGDLVYTDSTTQSSDLTDIFVQGYNFGGDTHQFYWDNISVSGGGTSSVPEGGGTALLTALAFLGMISVRKRP